MQSFSGVAQKPNGDVMVGVSVLIKTHPGDAVAVLYDINGAVVTNPVETDNHGVYGTNKVNGLYLDGLYAANGRYSSETSGPGISGTIVKTDSILLQDLAPSNGAASVGDNTGGGLWTTLKGFITYLLSSAGSSLVGFIQSGIGAVLRAVQDVLRERVSIEDFGIVGDGSTDDLAKLNSGIASRSNVEIIFTKLCAISGPLNVTNNNVHLVGRFGGGIVRTGTGSGIVYTGTNGGVDGLVVTGNQTGNISSMPSSYGGGVIAWRTSGLTVKNCRISGWGSSTQGAGVYFSSSQNCKSFNNKIDNCLNGYNDDDYGATVPNGFKSVACTSTDDVVSNSRATGMVIDFGATEGLDISHGASIINPTVYSTILNGGSYGSGIVLNDANKASVIGGSSYSNAGHGILLQLQTQHSKVIGLNATKNTLNGLEVSSYTASTPFNNTFEDCVLNNNTQNGAHFSYMANCVFSKNQCNQNGFNGVLTDNFVKSSTLSGNIVTRNGKNGMHLTDSFALTVDGNIVNKNGQLASNTYSGIKVEKVTYDYYGIRVSNSIMDVTSQGGSETQKYGIEFVTNANSRFNAILSNHVSGQVTAPYFDGATGTDFGTNVTAITINNNAASIDSNQGTVFNVANTIATNVTAISGGDTIYLKTITLHSFNANTTLVHSGTLYLKGAVNAALPNSGVITLIGNSGGWIEVSRNF